MAQLLGLAGDGQAFEARAVARFLQEWIAERGAYVGTIGMLLRFEWSSCNTRLPH